MSEAMVNVAKYIQELVAEYPAIREVWLIGSRANQSAREDSDWDMLVFTESGVLDALRDDVRFHHLHIDLLVVNSTDDHFEKPWGDKRKKGTLQAWKWKRLTESEASYESQLWIPDPIQKYAEETGDWEDLKLKALRLWPQ
ncbi:MAG: nucleotidyltransferase domain-containing protein [Pseudomonadota bacterium]